MENPDIVLSEERILGQLRDCNERYIDNAAAGYIVGCIIGLLISNWLYGILIASHFSYADRNFPVAPLLGILLFVLATVTVAVYAPSKRMRNMELTKIINEL